MSLLTVALLALGYLVVVLFVVALLRAATRADEALDREYEALVRSLAEEARVVSMGDHEVARRRSRAG